MHILRQMYAIYTVVLSAGLIAALPYYAARFRKYLPALGERMGFGPGIAGTDSIWIHAVSVGEVRAVDPLIPRIRDRFPERPIVLSTTTPTGRALAIERDDIDLVIYFPFDLPGPVRRSLERIRPAMVIVAETEIWPNFLRMCARERVPVFLVNGRISDRSLGRYSLARRWLGRVLDGFRLLAMQSGTDADRILSLGAPSEKVVVLGNLKYDNPSAPAQIPQRLQSALRVDEASRRPLIVAASTAEGEELLVLEAFRQVRSTFPGARLLVAPRRPERFDTVYRIITERDFDCVRRSGIGEPAHWSGDVLLLDSIGELSGVFESATVVFMGGTLVPRGGHNILEPARAGRPIIFGTHMENFREISETFLKEDAGIQVDGVDDLAERIVHLLDDPRVAERFGANAKRVAEENRGAADRTVDAITRSMAAGPGLPTP